MLIEKDLRNVLTHFCVVFTIYFSSQNITNSITLTEVNLKTVVKYRKLHRIFAFGVFIELLGSVMFFQIGKKNASSKCNMIKTPPELLVQMTLKYLKLHGVLYKHFKMLIKVFEGALNGVFGAKPLLYTAHRNMRHLKVTIVITFSVHGFIK